MADFDGLIALDGPAGAGKTTLGHWLADRLGYDYLETGFLYRAGAYVATKAKVDENRWNRRLVTTVDVVPRTPLPEGTPQQVLIDGCELNVQQDLFSERVDALVARVAAIKDVRAAVRELVRAHACDARLIISGRDVGTAIVPEAGHKLFLTADEGIRANRLGRRGDAVRPAAPLPQPSVRATATPRHELESKLLSSHLHPAPDALVLDTTALTVDAVRLAALQHLGHTP